MSLIDKKKFAHNILIKNLYINGHFIKKKKKRLAQKPKTSERKKKG